MSESEAASPPGARRYGGSVAFRAMPLPKEGYKSVDDMIADFRTGADAQVLALTRYLAAEGLDDALRDLNIEALARFFAATEGARAAWAARYRRAYQRRTGAKPHVTLKPGDKGRAVERLQELLVDQGARLRVDGEFGAATRLAVRGGAELRQHRRDRRRRC